MSVVVLSDLDCPNCVRRLQEHITQYHWTLRGTSWKIHSSEVFHLSADLIITQDSNYHLTKQFKPFTLA